MHFFLSRLTFLLVFIILSHSVVKAQDCLSSIDPMELIVCNASGGGLDQNCNCVPCDSNPSAVGCAGDGEVPVPIDDYVWVIIGVVVIVGFFQFKTEKTAA